MMNEPKAQKILPNFCCSERRERRMMIKKILPNFCCSAKLHTGFVILQSLHFSRALCDHPSSCILWSLPPAVFRLVDMLRFPLHVHFCPFCTPLYVPPPQARSPRRNDVATNYYWRLLARIRAREGRWGLKSRAENRLKVITEYE